MRKYIKQEPTTMRLKGFWRDRKGNGQKLWYKLRDYRWQLRYAWKRAWNGYDDIDVFDFGFALCERLSVTLKAFAADRAEEYERSEIDDAVDKIIDLLDYAVDPERAARELFPDTSFKLRSTNASDWEESNYTYEQMKIAMDMQNEKVREAFVLLGDNYDSLWT